jgi:LysM repeat protein
VKAAAFAMTGVLCLFGCSGGGGSKSQSSSTLVTGAPPSSGLAPSTAPPSTAPPSPAPATPAPTVPGVYIVQKGDSLTSIAKQFGVTVAQLVAANNIKNQDHIEEGQRLTIPPTTVATATTRPGTTVAGKPGTTRATTTTTLHR